MSPGFHHVVADGRPEHVREVETDIRVSGILAHMATHVLDEVVSRANDQAPTGKAAINREVSMWADLCACTQMLGRLQHFNVSAFLDHAVSVGERGLKQRSCVLTTLNV